MDKRIEELRNLNLDLEELKNRKEEIKRKALEHRSTITSDAVDEARAEVENINQKIAECEARQKELQKENQGENRTMNDYLQNNENSKVDIRTAFAKYVLANSTKRSDIKMNDVELRALGVSNTTTSDTYVEATAQADGVNNGGIFIPQIGRAHV